MPSKEDLFFLNLEPMSGQKYFLSNTNTIYFRGLGSFCKEIFFYFFGLRFFNVFLNMIISNYENYMAIFIK